MSCLCLWFKPTPSIVYLILSSLNLPFLSYIISYFLSPALFQSAYKQADIFPIKKSLEPAFSFSYCPHFLPFTEKLWKNCSGAGMASADRFNQVVVKPCEHDKETKEQGSWNGMQVCNSSCLKENTQEEWDVKGWQQWTKAPHSVLERRVLRS